jgi:hypothetical protein
MPGSARLLTGRFCRSVRRLVLLLIHNHRHYENKNDGGPPDEYGNSEIIHGRYYTDYGVTAGISMSSTVSFVVSTT